MPPIVPPVPPERGTLTPTYAHEEMKVYRGEKVESRKFAER
jgi:hypothetical protein